MEQVERGPRLGEGGFWVRAAEAPTGVAVVDIDGTELTAAQLERRVNRLSNAMVADGVRPGTDIAVLAWNRSDALALILAASQIGAYYTMVNTHLTTPEVGYILADSQPILLFVDRHTAALGHRAAAEVGIDPEVMRALDGDLGFPIVDGWAGSHSEERPLLRGAGSPMMYTSGTSGLPKGVRPQLTGQDPDVAAAGSTQLIRRYGLEPEVEIGHGVHLVTAPLYHAAPMHNALAGLHLGHKVVVMERFDPETALRLIHDHQVTWTQMVPTMMRRMLDLPEDVKERYDTSSLRRVIHAGAPCPVEIKRRMIDWLGPVVWEYYSSTEGGGTSIGPEQWLRRPGSVGRPWPGADVRILDDDGNELKAGEVGTIYMLSNRPFSYHNAPERTAEAKRGDYVTAGDLGHLDDDGFLYIADRRTDLILVGGVNVYPAEVEGVLMGHPNVADAAVIGRPDPDLGQVVHAVIAPRHHVDHPETLAAELDSFLNERLSAQKRPRSYAFREELPRSEAGKLLRRVLREELQ
jgi:long-chain acyl-CoA synthetase